jgi:hypothetical protein
LFRPDDIRANAKGQFQMALSIKDIVAASYPAVLAAKRQPANQWAESAVLRTMEKMGFVKRKSLGATIECPLDYVANAGGEFLATDITATSLSKTSVIGAASYAVAEVSVPIVWTKKDEATNPTENQKIAYVKSLLENGISTHDDLIESALFAAAATQGFLSLPVLASEDGTGTIGGIVAGTDTMWKNQFDDYGDATALLASMGTVFNACAKGSGSMSKPTLLITSPATHGVYEGKLVANQRFVDADEASGGFKSLAYRTAKMIFSHAYDGDSIFFANPKSLQLVVSKEFFRHRGETNEIDDANAYVTKLYSALQLVTDNRSRLGVAFT